MLEYWAILEKVYILRPRRKIILFIYNTMVFFSGKESDATEKPTFLREAQITKRRLNPLHFCGPNPIWRRAGVFKLLQAHNIEN